ncbi:uncharacterized protein LOC128555205 [Mercenaria mercenaria]|uniref:uncharacterized protein LOC128555205 n=1 Tax=Mercenaria mercenaria TaxID=6596 RepID=UPI00234E512C|nr:uncharacterized protein LOC128555205 [Mercenaria mercenaria]
MASLKNGDFEEVEKEVFEKLKKDDNVDYVALENDPEEMKIALTKMKDIYDEAMYMMSHANSLDEALGHLSPERRELIKTSFRLQSFNVAIQKQTDGTISLLFASLEGTPLKFVPSVVQIDASNYKKYRSILVARIILEAVVLVLNFIGLKVPPSQKVLAEAIDVITTIMSAHSELLGDVDDMIKAEAAKDYPAIGRAIVRCLINLISFVTSPILGLVKIIIQDMSWWDIIITIVQVACFIITIIATGGAALVAKIISMILDAAAFLKKLVEVKEFDAHCIGFSA